MTDALNQDIELRIRFAEYFAFVSTDSFKKDWIDYHRELVAHRNDIRKQIDEMEDKWQQKAQTRDQNGSEIDHLERNLAWAYKEVGYVERNRSVSANPRAPDLKPVTGGAPLTADALIQLFSQLRNRRDDLQLLFDAATEFGISDQNDLAIFLSIVMKESNFLSVEVESFDYSAEKLLQVWPTRFQNLEVARMYAHKPEQIANFVYGDRLGNSSSGDGYKFRGRGFIQITGRDQYRDIDQRLGLGVQLLDDPDKLFRDRKLNARAAALYYSQSTGKLRSLGQPFDLVQALRAVNGGLNGLSEGMMIYNRIIRGPA